MGMIANYQYLSNENLNEMKHFNGEEDEIFEEVEDWNEEVEILLDIDKMWDGLHFVLTGVGASNPIEDNPLSIGILGDLELVDDEDFFNTYTSADNLPQIIAAMEAVDIKAKITATPFARLHENNIYPDIWDEENEDEFEEIAEELAGHFQNLLDFYRQCAANQQNVVVVIA